MKEGHRETKEPVDDGAGWNPKRSAGLGVTVAVVFIALFMLVPGGARAGPSGMPCITCVCMHDCGGGTCPTPYTVDLTSAIANLDATDATITYQAASGSPAAGGTANVYWGPNTNYPYTAATGQTFVLGVTYPADSLSYLIPSTTYYYKIVATAYCTDSAGTHTYTGTLTGSWTTPADAVQTISGTIYDANGAVDTSGDLYVSIGCVSGGTPGWTLTSTTGTYGVTVYNAYSGWACNSQGYVVSLENYPVDWTQELGVDSGVWVNHWNETIVVPAPQVVNFYLPMNYVSGFVPMTYDFTNSPYTTYTISSSSTFTTQVSYGLSISGAIDGVSVGGGTSYQSSMTATQSSTYTGPTGDSVILQEKFLVTGTEVFNGFNRVVSLFPTYYEASGTIGSGPTSVADPLTQPACNTAPNILYCIDIDGQYQHSMSDGGSVTMSSSFNVGVSIPLDIPEIGITSGSVSASYTISFTTSNSASYSVGFTVNPPAGECYGFEWEYQGDNSNTNGMVAHVWNLGSEPASDC